MKEETQLPGGMKRTQLTGKRLPGVTIQKLLRKGLLLGVKIHMLREPGPLHLDKIRLQRAKKLWLLASVQKPMAIILLRQVN